MPRRHEQDGSTTRPPRVVLVETQHPGNIGAAARAMDVMGLEELYLVAPRQFPDAQATAMAAESRDLLERARVVKDLSQAIDDCTLVIAATRRSRQRYWPNSTVSDAMSRARSHGDKQTVAVVFGPEPSGLTTAQVQACDVQAEIPTAGGTGSLNLAQAVQVFAWEWLRLGSVRGEAQAVEEWATVEQRKNLASRLEQRLAVWSGDARGATKAVLRLRALWQRSGLTASEWRLLNGLLRGPIDD
jgi:TrmH family RNA methyltransferase